MRRASIRDCSSESALPLGLQTVLPRPGKDLRAPEVKVTARFQVETTVQRVVAQNTDTASVLV